MGLAWHARTDTAPSWFRGVVAKELVLALGAASVSKKGASARGLPVVG